MTNTAAIIGLVVVGVSGYVYMYGVPFTDRFVKVAEIGENAAPATINLSPEDLPQNVGDSVQKDGYTITKELVPESERGGNVGAVDLSKIPTPNYTKIPARPSGMPVESYDAVVAKLRPLIADITKQIEKNAETGSQTLYTDGWLDVALYRNMLGDTAGAKEIWLYLVQASPGLVQPYGNLGNMYMTQQSFVEAEKWYKIAIEKMPNALQYYSDLADIYAAQKRTADMVTILKKGIAADTKSWNLLVMLGRHYNSVGDIKNAHTQFNNAIERAKKAGNTQAVEAIEAEKIYTN